MDGLSGWGGQRNLPKGSDRHAEAGEGSQAKRAQQNGCLKSPWTRAEAAWLVGVGE